ncbi:MAG: hypothetical protein K5891_09660 [Lachnospiraceae bacterium]|nr:hypothetical protein [Lachnospiraceae bacterium]
MIAFLIMALGGLLALSGLIFLVLFAIEPLYRRFMIVIKRKDDYTYYLRPEGAAFLKKTRKEYLIGAAALLVAGSLLFLFGYYMRHGARGVGDLLRIQAEEEYSVGEEPVTGNQAAGINAAGHYVDQAGNEYRYFFQVRGSEIYFREDRLNSFDEVQKCLADVSETNLIYLVDNYASAKTFKELRDYLHEHGYETGEENE